MDEIHVSTVSAASAASAMAELYYTTQFGVAPTLEELNSLMRSDITHSMNRETINTWLDEKEKEKERDKDYITLVREYYFFNVPRDSLLTREMLEQQLSNGFYDQHVKRLANKFLISDWVMEFPLSSEAEYDFAELLLNNTPDAVYLTEADLDRMFRDRDKL